MPGPMSTTNSITVYKNQISEWFASHKFCTGMRVPLFLFCILYKSPNFRTLQ